ncbi:unnamed protein product [Miscanthus lutarioriparius]|uniref:Uncharacterized protein n=1 Tax=Miscanthus lutarioriparius TaxID=422564 RepID=A0A811QPZ5_9POAL|nr:unnamed protein product [Miscanthus lutarioriparius]
MSLLPVLLLSPSSSGSACGGRRFLCMSQRSADDALFTKEDVLPDDVDDEAGIAAFLCASHRSTESARPVLAGRDVALLREDPRPGQLLMLSAEVERGLDEAEDSVLADLALCASYFSSESALQASGAARGSIFHLGGVGSSAGRAASRCSI